MANKTDNVNVIGFQPPKDSWAGILAIWLYGTEDVHRFGPGIFLLFCVLNSRVTRRCFQGRFSQGIERQLFGSPTGIVEHIRRLSSVAG